MISRNGIFAAGLLVALSAGAVAQTQNTQTQASAVFAAGCFWCTEADYDKVPGVASTTSGYLGGTKESATYEKVSGGRTGHKEAVKVVYDAAKVSYQQLLEVYWRNVDPFDGRGQFCDKGDQYTSAVYVQNDEQRQLAEQSKQKVVERLGKAVVTEVLPDATFYPAEDYHQDYYLKHPAKYKFYRWNCGRDQRLEQINAAAG